MKLVALAILLALMNATLLRADDNYMARVDKLVEAGLHVDAIAVLEPLAQKDDPQAQYRLARIYALNLDNVERAFELLNAAAKLDYVPAFLRLGEYYNEKRYRNIEKAFYWYKKAAAREEPEALVYLGIAHSRGKFVKKDTVLAEQLFERAAKVGDAEIVRTIGQAYVACRDISWTQTQTRNKWEKARSWLERAAARGSNSANWDLTYYYFHGCGPKQNRRKAVEWFFKMDGGRPHGKFLARWYGETAFALYPKKSQEIFKLGEAYKYGIGVPADIEKAYATYYEAAQMGSPCAAGAIANLQLSHKINIGRDAMTPLSWALLFSSFNRLRKIRSNCPFPIKRPGFFQEDLMTPYTTSKAHSAWHTTNLLLRHWIMSPNSRIE
jgi:TPR repeat protein